MNLQSEVTKSQFKAELTTGEAANLLFVSRPFLMKLLEGGKIPYHKVGSRLKLRRKDVLAYKNVSDAQRRKALRELVREAQELNMGY
jgi:excisionase family DNA binding protein